MLRHISPQVIYCPQKHDELTSKQKSREEKTKNKLHPEIVVLSSFKKSLPRRSL